MVHWRYFAMHLKAKVIVNYRNKTYLNHIHGGDGQIAIRFLFFFQIFVNNLICLAVPLTLPVVLIHLYYFKVHKNYKIPLQEWESTTMCYINILLNIVNFSKYCILKLLYMIVTNCQNKKVYNKSFSRMCWCFHRTHPC